MTSINEKLGLKRVGKRAMMKLPKNRAEADRVFAVMALAPQHTFQLLTKRPERMRDYVTAARSRIDAILLHADDPGVPADRWPLPNVWLAVSCENQTFADQRIPLLLQTPAAVRFISAEPLLGPLSIEPWLGATGKTQDDDACRDGEQRPPASRAALGAGPLDSSFTVPSQPRLDWVVAGGESGQKARPSHPRLVSVHSRSVPGCRRCVLLQAVG